MAYTYQEAPVYILPIDSFHPYNSVNLSHMRTLQRGKASCLTLLSQQVVESTLNRSTGVS